MSLHLRARTADAVVATDIARAAWPSPEKSQQYYAGRDAGIYEKPTRRPDVAAPRIQPSMQRSSTPYNSRSSVISSDFGGGLRASPFSMLGRSLKAAATTGVTSTTDDEDQRAVTRPMADRPVNAYVTLRRAAATKVPRQSEGEPQREREGQSLSPTSIPRVLPSVISRASTSQPRVLHWQRLPSQTSNATTKVFGTRPGAPPRRCSSGDMTLLSLCGQLQNLPFVDSDSDEDSDTDDDTDTEDASVRTPRDELVMLPQKGASCRLVG